MDEVDPLQWDVAKRACADAHAGWLGRTQGVPRHLVPLYIAVYAEVAWQVLVMKWGLTPHL